MAISIHERYTCAQDPWVFPDVSLLRGPLELRVDKHRWKLKTPRDVLGKLQQIYDMRTDTFRCSTVQDIAVHSRGDTGKTSIQHFSRNELGSIRYITDTDGVFSEELPLSSQLRRVRNYFTALDKAYAHIPPLSEESIDRILTMPLSIGACDDALHGQGVFPEKNGGCSIAVAYYQPRILLCETILHEMMHLHVFQHTGIMGMDGSEYPQIALGDNDISYRLHQWLHHQATKVLNKAPYLLAYFLHNIRAYPEARPWLKLHALPQLRAAPIDLEQLLDETLPGFRKTP